MLNLTTFQRCDKLTFDRAYADGKRVAIAKDPAWARGNDTLETTGFTKETVSLSEVYADGPSRPGEVFVYWVETPIGETVSPAEPSPEIASDEDEELPDVFGAVSELADVFERTEDAHDLYRSMNWGEASALAEVLHAANCSSTAAVVVRLWIDNNDEAEMQDLYGDDPARALRRYENAA